MALKIFMINPKKNLSKSGFTLIELMIVLVVIAVVASIATMSGLAARVRANEGSAQVSLKTIAIGAEMYLNNFGAYPSNLASFGADYVPSDLMSGQKSGYLFELRTGGGSATYTATTVPMNINYTGVRSYCINNLNAISVYTNAPALTADGTNCPPGGALLSA